MHTSLRGKLSKTCANKTVSRLHLEMCAYLDFKVLKVAFVFVCGCLGLRPENREDRKSSDNGLHILCGECFGVFVFIVYA